MDHQMWRVLESWLPVGHHKDPQPLGQPLQVQLSVVLWPQGNLPPTAGDWPGNADALLKRSCNLSRPRKLLTTRSRGGRIDTAS